MHRFTAPTVLALALTCAGPALAESRDLSGFTAVSVSGGYEVDVVQGEAFEVSVEGEDADQLKAVVRDGELRLRPELRIGINVRGNDVRVRVQMPRIDALSANMGANVRVAGVTASELELSASLGGVLAADNVQAGALRLRASQGASIAASGTCETLDANASLGAVIEAAELRCAAADVRASTGGDVQIVATHSIDANASLGGAIDVDGAPGTRNTGTSLGGHVGVR